MNPETNIPTIGGPGTLIHISAETTRISNDHDGQSILGGPQSHGGKFQSCVFTVPTSGNTVTLAGGSVAGGNPPVYRIEDCRKTGDGTLDWQPATPVSILDVRNWNSGMHPENSGEVTVDLTSTGAKTTTITLPVPQGTSNDTFLRENLDVVIGTGATDWDGWIKAGAFDGSSFDLTLVVKTAAAAGSAVLSWSLKT